MAEEKRINVYEGMFLISQAEATDFAGVIEHIQHLFDRSEAKLLAMQKWDERRLAYEIDKQKRGVYILAYFEAPAEKLQSFERDCNLSERLMRVLVTRADHLSAEEIQAMDKREELHIEAKERAERAREREQAGMSSSVSLGAPKLAEEPKTDDVPSEEGETPTGESEAAEPAPAEAGQTAE